MPPNPEQQRLNDDTAGRAPWFVIRWIVASVSRG